MEANITAGSARPLSRRRGWIVLLVGVTGIVGIGTLLSDGSPGRKELRGRVKSPTGGGWRMTVAADWAVNGRMLDGSTEPPPFYTLTAPPPSPMRRWIDAHLLHRPTAAPVIYLRRYRTAEIPGYFRLQDGYPEPSIARRWDVRTRRHFPLDGCFATLLEVNPAPGETLGQEVLLVHVPDQGLLYILGSSLRLSGTDPAYQEMQAILHSFHIEQDTVTVGQGRKPDPPTSPSG